MGTISLTQTGANLTATTTDGAGSTCQYTGTAGANVITLNWVSCQLGQFTGLTCANNARRDMTMITNSITATISGTTATGNTSQTWNVMIANTQTGVGPMTLTGTFNATRR